MRSLINTIWKRPAPLKHLLGCFVQVSNFSLLRLRRFNVPGPSMAYFSTSETMHPGSVFPPGCCLPQARAVNSGWVLRISRWGTTHRGARPANAAPRGAAAHSGSWEGISTALSPPGLPDPEGNRPACGGFGSRQGWLQRRGRLWRESGRCLSRVPFTTTCPSESRTSLLQVHTAHKPSLANSS